MRLLRARWRAKLGAMAVWTRPFAPSREWLSLWEDRHLTLRSLWILLDAGHRVTRPQNCSAWVRHYQGPRVMKMFEGTWSPRHAPAG